MTRIIARNSAPMRTKSPAALKNAMMRKSTEWTGFRAEMTRTPEATAMMAKIQKAIAWMIMACPSPAARRSPVGRVERDVLRDLRLPPLAVREELVLVVEELLARLGGEL